jgi:hypothetical protein
MSDPQFSSCSSVLAFPTTSMLARALVSPTLMRRSSATKPMPLPCRRFSFARTAENTATSFSRPYGDRRQGEQVKKGALFRTEVSKLDADVKRAVAHLKSVNGVDIDHFGGFGAQRSRKLFLQQFDLHSSSTAMNALNGAPTSPATGRL